MVPELTPESLDSPQNIFSLYKQSQQNQQDLFTTIMVLDALVTTDGSGVYHNEVGSNPSADANWATLAAAFDEYRTLGIEVEFRPIEWNGGLIQQAPITSVIDYDNNAALTGYTLAAQYSSVIEFPGGRSFNRRALMSGAENAQFLSTASPANVYWIKFYSANNTATTNIGRLLVKHLVQFRGKGI
jgi:hypothetical protein